MMDSWKRILGVDVVEALLIVAGTVLSALLLSELTHDRLVFMGTILAGIVGFGIRRYNALKALPPEGETSGAWRAAELEARVAELEQMSARLAELEERVDFSERLLASKGEPVRIEAPR